MHTNESISARVVLIAWLLTGVIACNVWAQDAAAPPSPPAPAAVPDVMPLGAPPSAASVPTGGEPFNVMLPLEDATYLGVVARPVDQTVTSQLKLVPGIGLAVAHVDGPADEADIKLNDILLQLDDQKLINPGQLAVLVRAHNAGDVVNVSLMRDGQPLEVKVTLGVAKLPPLKFDSGFPFGTPPSAEAINAHAELAQQHVAHAMASIPRNIPIMIGSPDPPFQVATHHAEDMGYTIRVIPGEAPRLVISQDNGYQLYQGTIPPRSKWSLLPGKPEITTEAMQRLTDLLGLQVED